MKILFLANELKKDISSSGIKLKRATETGYNIAERNAKIYKLGSTRKYFNAARSIGNKIIKNTARKEIPFVAGAIGMFIPLPFASPVLMGLGFLYYLAANAINKRNNAKTDIIA